MRRRRLVVTYRQWLAGRGAGGPVPLEQDSAWLPKQQILDSYVQHTQNCSACSKVQGCLRLKLTAHMLRASALAGK